jgi:hypothetical protein
MMMELKEQYDKYGGAGSDDDDDGECAHCEQYEKENEVLREQTEQQSQVIEKLSKAQEMLMMQYKVLELGLNKELQAIQITQLQIEAMKNEVAGAGDAPPEETSEEPS